VIAHLDLIYYGRGGVTTQSLHILTPYTKELAELLHIPPYTVGSEGKMCMQSTVNGESPENQHNQWSKQSKELAKVLTCGCSPMTYRLSTTQLLARGYANTPC